jgi:UDP-N-acetylglucosamine 2-epimerase (non-hydrolysing)
LHGLGHDGGRLVKILAVLGTRPEAIKLAPVIRELQRRASDRAIDCQVCVTAQQREMLDQVLRFFEIVPDFDLNVMEAEQTLPRVTAAIMERLDGVLRQAQPDWVLVQGDTTTAAIASLVAYYHRLPVGHVEAGLRTYDKYQPFPEEVNRRLIGVIANRHFTPTTRARENLLREGVSPGDVLVTGNPVVDALSWIVRQPPSERLRALLCRLGIAPRGGLHDAEVDPWPEGARRRLVLVTAHRRENFGQPLEDVCRALRYLAQHYAPALQIVYPVHLNPQVQSPVYRLLGDIPNVTLIPPLDYRDMVHLLLHAYLALTDSGGIQEEAPSLGIPVLVMREVTERPEGVEAGVLRLTGTNPARIIAESVRLLEDPTAYRAMVRPANPYGDGRAAERIVAGLLGEPVEEWEMAATSRPLLPG